MFDLASATVAIKADLAPFDKGLAKARDNLGRYLPNEKTVTVKFHTPDVDVFAKGFGGGDGSTYRLADENQKWVESIMKVKAALATVPAVRATRLELITSGFTAGLVKAKTALAATLTEMKASAAAAATSVLPLLAIGVATELLRKGIMGASDLAESASKMEVTFGAAAGKVKEFAAEMSSAFGTPNQEVFDAVTNIGLLGKGIGLTADGAADLGIKLSRMASDASSFFNTSFEEALGKISSGLRGESEPLRAFGVLLDEDSVKAEAFRLGIAKASKELTQQQKVMARSSLIEKGLAVAQGDRARTASGFSNQMKELADRISTLATTIGGMLTPVLTPLLQRLNQLAQEFQAIAGYAGTAFSRVAAVVGLGGAASAGVAAAGGEAPAAKAAPAPGISAGLEAAKAAIAKESEAKAEARLKDKARDEAAAKEKADFIAKMNAKFYRDEAIRKLAAEKRSKMAVMGVTEERRADESAYLDKLALRRATEEVDAKSKTPGFGPKGDATKPARDTIDKVGSVLKELGRKLPGLKQQGLGAVGGALNAFAAQGDQAREDKARRKKIAEEKFDREEEKRRHFTSQIFQGGADYHNSAQTSILKKDSEEMRLTREQREKNKEIAANTKEAAVAMKNLLSAFLANAKGAKGTVAILGGP